ncbi:hypothetical protein HYH03_007931 [Edaphochlamys debaryana]|uniref:Uncharacterized protein n=1 Tax=Edaphochlamys debaryana TaxID=47281 RepID=A0A836C020_9CHLO|nr:hypothetical protein HYH03_007931 [Edaphochlamys debaryana]|eukprot:KAG2494004.1 hypothetical protein HYH03_007931 [Edaphochlamys debaryana]
MDLIVSWSADGSWQQASLARRFSRGAVYGGDNLNATGPPPTNYEEVYWPEGVVPDNATYYACALPWRVGVTFNVTFKALVDGVLVKSTWKTMTTDVYPTWYECLPDSVWGLDTFAYPPSQAPASPPPAPPAPPPASPFTLLLHTSWAPTNPGANLSAVYDNDLLVTWVRDGVTYNVSYDYRTTRGGSYGGDNVANRSAGLNEERVYWLRGGQAPDNTTYHVCVQLYTIYFTYNITMTASVDGALAKTSWAVWDGMVPNPSVCYPGANGYVGNFTYAAGQLQTAGSTPGTKVGAAKEASASDEGSSGDGQGPVPWKLAYFAGLSKPGVAKVKPAENGAGEGVNGGVGIGAVGVEQDSAAPGAEGGVAEGAQTPQPSGDGAGAGGGVPVAAIVVACVVGALLVAVVAVVAVVVAYRRGPGRESRVLPSPAAAGVA